MQIRHKYSDWPMAYLWLTSYVSIPFSNLCWLFAKGSFHGPTLSFLYPLLPSFLTPADPHAYIHEDLSIIDGASTYLVAYALDFSYLGIYLANLVLGIGCGWLRERALPRNLLVAGILLTCLSFIFFSDMFTPLSTILQIAIQARCSEGVSSGERSRLLGWCPNERDQAGICESVDALKVMAVIVLYRIAPEESPAFRSVMAARKAITPELGEVRVLLWDNSPREGAGRTCPKALPTLQMRAIQGWPRRTTGRWSGQNCTERSGC